MTTKKTPATPLPITTACDEEFRANADEGRKYRAEQDRRANAYPRLVADMRGLIGYLEEMAKHDKTKRAGYCRARADTARALLAELGE